MDMRAGKIKMIIVLGIIWTVAIVVHFSNIREEDRNKTIATAFAKDDYVSTVSRVVFYGNCKNSYIPDDEKADIIQKVAGVTGINEKINVITERRKTGVSVTYEKVEKGASFGMSVVSLENVDKPEELNVEQYIFGELVISDSLDSGLYYQEKIEKCLCDMGIEAEVTLTLEGVVSGEIEKDEIENLCESVIDELDGEVKMQRSEDGVYQVYGYIDKIKDYVITDKEKTNINIAVKYDEESNCTKIYMATPYINTSY